MLGLDGDTPEECWYGETGEEKMALMGVRLMDFHPEECGDCAALSGVEELKCDTVITLVKLICKPHSLKHKVPPSLSPWPNSSLSPNADKA